MMWVPVESSLAVPLGVVGLIFVLIVVGVLVLLDTENIRDFVNRFRRKDRDELLVHQDSSPVQTIKLFTVNDAC